MIPRGRPRNWSRWLALTFVLLGVLSPRLVVASPGAESLHERPVIIPGRELEVLALLEPHALGDELAPGWTLHSVSIDIGTITIWLAGPGPRNGQRHGQLTLDHRDHGPPDARQLVGFALKVVQQPPGSEAAIDRLIAAIEINDDGSFWAEDVVLADEPRAHPDERAKTWALDGIVFFAFATLTLLALVAHKLRGAEAWMKGSLLGIVVLAVVLRLTLSPAVALAPWPYTRMLLSAELLFLGPGLAALHPGPVGLSEAIFGSTLALSILAPLAVYVHARYLLDDHRAGLVAALVIAILPLHLRFSQSDTAFIPSITLSSIVFSLIHAAMRERSKLGAWVAIALVGFPLALMYEVRPLNIMFYPLLLATAFISQGLHTHKPTIERTRTIAVFIVISAVTFGLGVPRLLENFGAQVHEGMSVQTLSSGFEVLFDPRLNELINPVFSPPGLTALAVIGAVDLWRRGRRRLLFFIALWLLGLLFAHAYVVPKSMYMQARYHLHLVVPYTLLVACGVDTSLRWLAKRHGRAWPWILGLLYVLASPLIHLHGIRHVELNDTQEWIFVHGLRDEIPKHCTIVEYLGPGASPRFSRVGTSVQEGVPHQRWRVLTLPDDLPQLLDDPPDCMYWYEGLPCFGNKSIEEPKAPACQAIEGLFELEEIASTRFESAPYDENLAAGLGELEAVELRLFRVGTRR